MDADGLLQGASVQSFPGKSIQELSQRQWVPQNQIGVTTLDRIRALGGDVVPDPSNWNPYHATLRGIGAVQAQQLFTPTIPNPNPRIK